MTTDVLVVTGGASGIGLACARRLGRRHARVALLDRDAAALEESAERLRASGIAAEGFVCDVARAEELEAIAALVEANMGPTSTLVLSAGIISNSETLMEMDLNRHREIWDVNYHGTVHALRAFARAMQERRRGAIVTLGSITGMGAFPLPAYSPSKTAIMRLTQLLAVELGRFDVRINCVAPTYVLSETVRARIASGLRDGEAILRSGALRTYVHPEDIAAAVDFLCSEDARTITGVQLPVDAGWKAATTYHSYAGGAPWAEKD